MLPSEHEMLVRLYNNRISTYFSILLCLQPVNSTYSAELQKVLGRQTANSALSDLSFIGL